MRSAVAGKTIAAWLVVAATGWWLFADTVRHYLPDDGDANVIRFCHWGGYPEYAMWRELIDAFEQAHPAIRVQQEYVAGLGFGYSTKIRQQLVADAAPDVILFQDEPFPAFAEHAFADLTALAAHLKPATAFFPTAHSSFVVDDALRGLPVFGGSLLIYCNQRCFRRASAHRGRAVDVPSDDWTLADFRQLTRDLTCDFDGDGRTDQYALVMPGWIYQLPLIWATGARVLDDTRSRWMLTDRAALDAFTDYQDLKFGAGVALSAGDLGQMNRDLAFLTDRVALYITGPWLQPFLAETSLRDDYAVVTMPQGPAGRFTRVTWDALCLNQRCPPQRREAAWKFIRFACAGPGQQMIARQQRAIPALRSAAETYRTLARHGGEKFVDEIPRARNQPITPHWHEMDRTIKRHLATLMAEEGRRTTPAEFLRELADDDTIRRWFSEAGAP